MCLSLHSCIPSGESLWKNSIACRKVYSNILLCLFQSSPRDECNIFLLHFLKKSRSVFRGEEANVWFPSPHILWYNSYSQELEKKREEGKKIERGIKFFLFYQYFGYFIIGGVGRGLISKKRLPTFHKKIQSLLASNYGTWLTGGPYSRIRITGPFFEAQKQNPKKCGHKARGGGRRGKALVARPIKNNLYFCGLPKVKNKSLIDNSYCCL